MTFTREQLQHILAIMNGDCISPECEICASARVTLAELIAAFDEKPTIERRILGGVPVIIEHFRG